LGIPDVTRDAMRSAFDSDLFSGKGRLTEDRP
jgi:hypothetical protein